MPSSVLSWFQPASRKQSIFLKVLLLGAPLALALSFLLHDAPGHHASFHIPLDRQKAIAAAHRTAERVGLDSRGWREQVRVQLNRDMLDYFRRRPIPQESRARSFAAEIGASVLLTAPDGGLYLTVTFAADGTEVDYRIAGKALKPAEPLGEEELLTLAAIEMKSLVDEMSLENLTSPEISASEAAGVSGVRRVTYRPFAPNAPDAEFAVHLDFLGGRLIAREIKAEPSEPFVARFQRQSTSLSTFGNIFRVVILLGFSFYGAFCFSRRIADREAPILRAIVLTCVIPIAGTIIFFLDPALSATELKPESFAIAGLIAALLGKMTGYLLQGIAMGTGYGGGEGSIRENFPGKLVSLDALLRGHVFSANAGQAIVTGTAIGCWLVLVYHLLLPLTGNPVTPSILINTAIAFSRSPWVLFFLKTLLMAFISASICLLVPLLIYRQLSSRRVRMAAVLLLTAMIVGPLDEAHSPDSADFWLRGSLIAISLIGSFFAWDYIAALAAYVAFSVLSPLADMLDRMPAWHDVLPVAGTLAAVTLLPMLVAALRGRLYSEKELLPSYARVQLERLSLQAELSAAREAQLRLLPASLPDVPGLSLAASCTPAREVGGDFYDFIQLDDGSLSVIVAEGGNDGLASALTIALAKGFLLFEANACRDVHHTLLRLERALGENLHRTSGRTAIALMLVNPIERTIGIARAGTFPRLLVLTAGGVTRDVSLLEDASDGIARGSLALEAGDSVLIYTDGLARLAEQRHQGQVDNLLRRAAGLTSAPSAATIHDLVLGAILSKDRKAPADLADDITAVVLSFTAAAVIDREEVA